ncbi:hypothetical protein [Mycobacterium shigaense]|uniref:hypothetical protein n=1 Tax=Mycobacterium shigaense TaxID=722731 RepID=UPI003B8A912D
MLPSATGTQASSALSALPARVGVVWVAASTVVYVHSVPAGREVTTEPVTE